jgi:hypothetical protein
VATTHIEFTVNDDGSFDLKLKGPKSIHALKADFDKDLAEFGGDSKTVERPELTEKETPLRVPAQRQAQAQRGS